MKALALLLLPLAAAVAARAADLSPDQVLTRARTGRIEFVRAASDVDRFAPRIATKEQFFPYIEMLDALAAVGKRFDVESMGIDPAKDLGANLTSNGAKWLRLDKDKPAFLRTFLKWSTNDTRVAVAGDSEVLLTGAETPAQLLAWSEGALTGLESMRELKADRAATQAFEELQGVVARLILARGAEFTPEQLSRSIQRAHCAPGLEEVLAFLDKETATTANAADRRRVADWAILVSENARKLGPGAPLHLSSDAGGVLLEALERALAAGDLPNEGRIDAALGALSPTQLNALIGQLVDLYGDQNVPPEQVDYLWALTERIMAHFPALTATRRWKDFGRLGVRLSTLHFLGVKSLEGVYRIRADGVDRTLIIAEIGGGFYALVLEPADGKSGATLRHAAFHYRNGRFRVAPASPLSKPQPLGGWPQIWIDPSGPTNTAEGLLFDSTGRPSRFDGKRVESFPRLGEVPGAPLDLDAVTGVYKGFAAGRGATLTLTTDGAQLGGSFTLDESTAAITLNDGDFDRLRGVVTLTAAEPSAARVWAQVRGVFSKDSRSFTGFALLGGAQASVKLLKTEDFR